jgi:hypothetical protein
LGQNPYPYVTGSSVRFTWNPTISPDGLAALYRVIINKNGLSTSTLTGLTEISVFGGVGDQISVSVQPVHALDFSQAAASSTASLSNTFLSPAADQDGDGMINSAEEIAGTSPFNASSLFQVSQMSPLAGAMTLTWPSVPGKTYCVQWSDALGTSSFGGSAQSPLIEASLGSTTSWTDPASNGTRRFYRVIVVP